MTDPLCERADTPLPAHTRGVACGSFALHWGTKSFPRVSNSS
jgi:hypothetical protein